jgi:hypothetical protein
MCQPWTSIFFEKGETPAYANCRLLLYLRFANYSCMYAILFPESVNYVPGQLMVWETPPVVCQIYWRISSCPRGRARQIMPRGIIKLSISPWYYLSIMNTLCVAYGNEQHISLYQERKPEITEICWPFFPSENLYVHLLENKSQIGKFIY